MDATTAFYEAHRKVVAQNKRDMDDWIKRLKRDGVKAAHPDDGWGDLLCRFVECEVIA